MPARIEIKDKNHNTGKEKQLVNLIKDEINIHPGSVKIIKTYNIDADLTEQQLFMIKNSLFCDTLTEDADTGFVYGKSENFDYAIEVAYKSGVTDNVGRTAVRGIENLLDIELDDNRVRSSNLYLFSGNLDKEQCEKIAKKALCNELIEEYHIYKHGNNPVIDYFSRNKTTNTEAHFKIIDLEVSDEELLKISEDGVLSLTLNEMHAIRDYYRKPDIIEERKNAGLPAMPTDIELELFAQTWSEHCKHKIFASDIEYEENGKTEKINSLFKTYIKGSTDVIGKNRDDLLSLFVDNAGIVKFNEKYAYCVKAETHNSPSALDPYGGAMTGIVGVNRDIIGTGMGAYPIFNTDVFCFGSPFTDDEDIPEGLLHPKRIFRGVHKGVKDGGNESGIPTVNGSIVFDKSFLGKPLVFCGTGGLMPLEINGVKTYEKYVKPGDLIVMVGGRIGKDGIHGATFSSAHLTETSPTSAVQIGDPITQKKMLDFLMEARNASLYSGLTDNGAGGLGSSVGEMAEFTNGAELELDKCPLKYDGLKPWEILISEAQERMTVAVPQDKIDAFLTLSTRRDVESTVIGKFNDTGFFSCYYNNQIVSNIDLKMLHEGVPKLKLRAVWDNTNTESGNEISELEYNPAQSLKKLLSRPNVASKEEWVRMYDHEVGARTVIKPFTGKDNDGPSDGAVLRVFPDSNEGLVVTHGIYPRYSAHDTYHMTSNVIDEAVRSAIVLGADPEALTGLDNFCWPDPIESPSTPDGAYKMAQLVRSCRALYDTTIAYNCPCISGKDSMKNDYRNKDKKISVLPTLLFTVVGKIKDISKAVSFYFKKPGDLIYLIGETRNELGCSEYYDMYNIKGGNVPKVVNPAESYALYKKIHTAIENKLLVSAHDLSDGGLAVALAECAFSGNLGAKVDLKNIASLNDETILFSESPSRILVSVKKDNEREFLDTIGSDKCFLLGETKSDKRLVINGKKVTIDENIDDLKKIWKNSLHF